MLHVAVQLQGNICLCDIISRYCVSCMTLLIGNMKMSLRWLIMSLASQVVPPDLIWTWPPSFHQGLCGQLWLKQPANYYMPLTTYCIHVCMLGSTSVSYRLRHFLCVLRFPLPIKLTATIWLQILKVALSTNQSITEVMLTFGVQYIYT